jgi:uncharacterized protein (TIGR03435 family)
MDDWQLLREYATRNSDRPQSRNPEAIKQALLDQFGLELVPGREPVEMLVVERAKD